MSNTQDKLIEMVIDRFGNDKNGYMVVLLLQKEEQQEKMIDWLSKNDTRDVEMIMNQVDRILGNKK